MATPEQHEEIIKGLRVMIHGFVTKGILNCSEMDILNNKLSPEKDELFLSFGINLRVAIMCCPLDPIIPLVKIESKDVFNDPCFDTLADGFQSGTVKIKLEQDYDVEEFDYSCDIDDESEMKDADFVPDEHDERNLDLNHELNNSVDIDEKQKKKKRGRPKKTLDLGDEYEPLKKMIKRKSSNPSGKAGPNGPIKKQVKNKKKFIPKEDCEECQNLANCERRLRNHCIEAHFFDIVHGLLKDTPGNSKYLTIDTMLQKKESLKNHFEIQIPPPDFTKEDFENSEVKNQVDQYLETDISTKLKIDNLDGIYGRKLCVTCRVPVDSMEELKDHQIKCHRLKFRCPKEKCEFNDLKKGVLFVEFIKHLHFHEQPLPQLAYPHLCLACDYKNAYLENVEKHIKSQGPNHDNKCPRCDLRFSTRVEIVEHMRLMRHEGHRCGFCNEVFDSENQLKGHKPHCKGRNEYVVCSLCGQDINKNKVKRHMVLYHTEDEPKICPHCGNTFRNELHLKEHINSKHKGISNIEEPCSKCGVSVKR